MRHIKLGSYGPRNQFRVMTQRLFDNIRGLLGTDGSFFSMAIFSADGGLLEPVYEVRHLLPAYVCFMSLLSPDRMWLDEYLVRHPSTFHSLMIL